MKTSIKTTIITLLLICGFNPLYAQPASNHTLSVASQTYISNVAHKEIKRLVAAGAIDKSWLKRPIADMTKKDFDKNLEWIISFNNKQIKETNKQILYVFVSLKGVLIGSNYSGE